LNSHAFFHDPPIARNSSDKTLNPVIAPSSLRNRGSEPTSSVELLETENEKKDFQKAAAMPVTVDQQIAEGRWKH